MGDVCGSDDGNRMSVDELAHCHCESSSMPPANKFMTSSPSSPSSSSPSVDHHHRHHHHHHHHHDLDRQHHPHGKTQECNLQLEEESNSVTLDCVKQPDGVKRTRVCASCIHGDGPDGRHAGSNGDDRPDESGRKIGQQSNSGPSSRPDRGPGTGLSDGGVILQINGGNNASKKKVSEPEEDVAVTLPEWEKVLRNVDGMESTVDVLRYLKEKMVLAGRKPIPWVHGTMSQALVTADLMDAVRYYFPDGKEEVNAVWRFGIEMVGHPEIVHGGATAFAFDETFGVLFSSLLLGPGFTANLEVKYKVPVPAGKTMIIIAQVLRREGRKIFLEGVAKDGPDGIVYAQAAALFIIPRKP